MGSNNNPSVVVLGTNRSQCTGLGKEHRPPRESRNIADRDAVWRALLRRGPNEVC